MLFKDYCSMSVHYYVIHRIQLNKLLDKSPSWVQSNIDSIGRESKSLKIVEYNTDRYIKIHVIGNKYQVRNSRGISKEFESFKQVIEAIR